jgi:transposase
VILGVDTHKDIHVAAVISIHGVLFGTRSFPTTARGYRGKTDAIDAEVAARAVLSGRATALAKTGDCHVERIRPRSKPTNAADSSSTPTGGKPGTRLVGHLLRHVRLAEIPVAQHLVTARTSTTLRN